MGFDASLLRTMLHNADSLMQARNFTAAESAYATIVAYDSFSASAHGGLASALLYSPQPRRNRSDALHEFEVALRTAPDNAVLHLRYGEALLPWRIPPDPGGETWPSRLNRAVVELQRSLALDPRSAEPHLALYLAYFAQGQQTEADDQLQEMFLKSFFPPPLLDYAWDLLTGVDSGAYVLTRGDIDTYPALMLQAITHLRPDVTIVNVSLLNAPWYVRYLKDERGFPVSFTDEQLETLGSAYSLRRGRTIGPGWRVLDAAFDNRSPTGGPFYFAITAGPDVMEPYRPNLSLEGFVYGVTGPAQDVPLNKAVCTDNLTRRYRIPEFTSGSTWKAISSPLDRSYGNLAVDCAAAFFALADRYRRDGDIGRASDLCHQASLMLVTAREREAFNRITDYWLEMAPQDTSAMRLKNSFLNK
jgi:tetratricopeptide (TPR) repeat protein